MIFWLIFVLAIVCVIARGFWLDRASITWPAADGYISSVDIERRNDAGFAGGYYYRATFAYDFSDPDGRHLSGTWHKNFSTESEARDFSVRELPVGKAVVVRFNPKNPASHDLELDSCYTNDRPTSLGI